jgi:hypothetical protein
VLFHIEISQIVASNRAPIWPYVDLNCPLVSFPDLVYLSMRIILLNKLATSLMEVEGVTLYGAESKRFLRQVKMKRY